jgi:hypothetical protein
MASSGGFQDANPSSKRVNTEELLYQCQRELAQVSMAYEADTRAWRTQESQRTRAEAQLRQRALLLESLTDNLPTDLKALAHQVTLLLAEREQHELRAQAVATRADALEKERALLSGQNDAERARANEALREQDLLTVALRDERKVAQSLQSSLRDQLDKAMTKVAESEARADKAAAATRVLEEELNELNSELTELENTGRRREADCHQTEACR